LFQTTVIVSAGAPETILRFFRAVAHTGAVVVALLLVGCSSVPHRVLINDDSLKPMLQAAASFDRARYGFTPIPKDPTSTTVFLESKPRDGYDAMLHISTKTYRTIAFRRTPAGYEWIGEQEIFQGPKRYKTADGTFNEAISLTYETVQMSGYPLNQLNIMYYGEDPRLAKKGHLKLARVQPILREWGY